MKKFWNWSNRAAPERTLFLGGTIAEESWFDDDVTPQLFKDELNAGDGDITVWINSPGGDCVAAAQIYNMLMDYKGKVTVKGTASWIEEGGAFPESDDAFGQVTIGAYKLGTTIKISEELLSDSVFDLESYIAREFARRIGAKEEEAFFSGDGAGKPLGVLADKGGAEVGVTAASATGITADELLDLYYSLFSPYRKKAVWVVNDSTIKAIRKLKDNNGQYLWQPGLIANAPDTILGRPVKTSAFMPSIAAGAKSILFGDFNYYWIADRQGRTFKRLNELYATTGQVGFLASQRVDGKLILPEALKVLKQKAEAGSGT